MSNDVSPTSPSNESLNISDHDALYRSLEESIKHPSCVSNEWIDTIGDLKNNPRLLNYQPYNDGAFYWVDKNNQLLHMAFPAVLDIEGKYSKLGPYFNLMGERDIKVTRFCFYSSIFLTPH